jgi:bacterioferritin-associated ferredoxin
MRFIIIRSDLQRPPSTMIVCICRRINDKTIAQCARSGMGFDDIQLELGVATQCGQCEGCARKLWSECSPQQPVAHISREEVVHQVLAV